jgi:anti-sigma regulatory factor (Ser/Thr protein kinase)
MNEADRIEVVHEQLDGCLVAHLGGVLDSLTYAYVRDSLVKLALEEPRAVVAQPDDLSVGSESLLSVFSSVWMRVNDWPNVPIFLVSSDVDRRAMIAHSAVSRFVPVFATVQEAVEAAEEGAPRRRRRAVYPPVLMCSAAARTFVRETCRDWRIESLTADALCLASELVENAIEHAGTELELRLELRRGMLTVAVRDGNPKQAVLRQDTQGQPLGYGLQIVTDLAKTWGCSPELRGGKVTWAVLTTGPRWFENHPAWTAPPSRPWSP